MFEMLPPECEQVMIRLNFRAPPESLFETSIDIYIIYWYMHVSNLRFCWGAWYPDKDPGTWNGSLMDIDSQINMRPAKIKMQL